VHSLHGSAMTFGMGALSEAARALELQLKPLAWIIHEFSDAKAPLMVERRCETSDLPVRRPLRERR
jgi:HPt (histidine-containing phosphotransfer) domain-containing protein